MVLARYLCSVQVLKFDEYFIKIVPNDFKSWSQIVELIRNGIPKRFFGFGARILRIGHFSGWKSKFFEVSSWHFKHPIKLNFLIWHLERPYPDKKSILEKRQFKSCPFEMPKFWFFIFSPTSTFAISANFGAMTTIQIWKTSILFEHFESDNILGTRALPRALRAMPTTTKMSFLVIF